MNKCIIIGGGTFNHVSCHLSLAAPSFGTTARILKENMEKYKDQISTELVLTKMADSSSKLVTNEDVCNYILGALNNDRVKAIIMNAALCDFSMESPSADTRLSSSFTYDVQLKGVQTKAISYIHASRPDIVVVGFKTTHSATEVEQFYKGFKLMKDSKLDFVVANDVGNYNNLLLTSSLEVYKKERKDILNILCDRVVKKVGEVECFRYA